MHQRQQQYIMLWQTRPSNLFVSPSIYFPWFQPKSTDSKVPDDTLHTPNVFPLIIETPNPDPVNAPTPPNKAPDGAPKPPRPYKRRQAVKNEKTQAFCLQDKNVTFLLPLPPNPSCVKVFSPKYFSVLARNASKGTNNVVPNKVTPKIREVRRDQSQARNDLLESNRLENNLGKHHYHHGFTTAKNVIVGINQNVFFYKMF